MAEATSERRAEGPLPRGRHGLSREQVSSSQRARLLEAMVEAAAEHGYANTPVAAVLERAGVSRQTFYELFGSKQDCFMTAFDEAAELVVSRVAEALDREEPHGGTANPTDLALERLDRGLAAYLAALDERRELARVFLIEAYAAGPAAIERRVRAHGRFADLIERRVPSGAATGIGDPGLRFRSEAFVAMVSALVTARVAAGEAARVEALREPIADLARRMLLPG